MTDYRLISIREFQEILRMIRGSKIISLTTITQPRVKKGGPKNLFKITRLNGLINCDYSNSVNNQREREGRTPDFIPNVRKWGTRLHNSPFVSHVCKDGSHELYLEIKIQRIFETSYKINWVSVKYEDIKEFLYKKRSNAEYQGLDKEVVWRDYNVKSIIEINIDGCGYILKLER